MTMSRSSQSTRRSRGNQHDADCRYHTRYHRQPAPVLFLDTCILLDNDGLALARAVDRIIAYRHPVKQPHSKGAKDSVILEHAVETTAQLRNAGFAQICIFVSSNTGDFANPGSANLHAQLEGSFNPVNLRYAVSLADAEGILTAADWVP